MHQNTQIEPILKSNNHKLILPGTERETYSSNDYIDNIWATEIVKCIKM